MKIIKRKAHAVLDYLSGITLIAAPWLFHFENAVMGRNIAIIIGVIILLMSVFTEYEGGIFHSIPMSLHLDSDIMIGIFLASSPWILEFSDQIYLPHLVMGLFAICIPLLSDRNSYVKPK